MIIRVTFEKRGEQFVMLFGNSYKTWQDQFTEYIFRNHADTFHGWQYKTIDPDLVIVKAEKSQSKWKSWGGLKWCREDLFQGELNREGVQQDEPDNPKPRQYDKMKFYEFDTNVLHKVLKKW